MCLPLDMCSKVACYVVLLYITSLMRHCSFGYCQLLKKAYIQRVLLNFMLRKKYGNFQMFRKRFKQMFWNTMLGLHNCSLYYCI